MFPGIGFRNKCYILPDIRRIVTMRGLGTIALAVCLCWAAAGETPSDRLFQAIRGNDLASLTAALRGGADVNTSDRRGTTLLMHAAAFGSAEAVQLLLDAGAGVNERNSFETTALILGARDPRKVRMLVEKGADVNARTKQGRTALMLAASWDGNADAVRLLLAKGADPKARDNHGISALRLAAEVDDWETMQLLAGRDADVAAADDMGRTPLGSAVENCNLPAIRFLLAKGARVNTPMTSAPEVKFGKVQLIGLTPLMLAAPYCPAEIVQTLLESGARSNAKDIRDMTPLMLAVASETQDLAVVRLLLKAGAALNAKSAMGETALDWAKKFGNREVIAALSAAGAREGYPHAPPERKAAASRSIAHAVESGAAILQRSSTEFFKQSGCVGCHHQPMTTMAVSAARSSGVRVDETAAQEHVRMAEAQWTSFQPLLLERIDTGGMADPQIFSAVSLGAVHYPASTVTDALAIFIANSQHRDGSWWFGGVARAPMEEGRIARTALALRALQLYAPPAQKAEFDQRIARARDFLLAARPATNDDRSMQLVGLHWAAAGAEHVQPFGRALIALQREDGGWAPNRNLVSDAFATGQSLWALAESGVLQAADPVYRHGVKYLLDTECADGSWYVRSRAVKFQPYFQSGFPFDHDQWISAAATAWAVIALAPAVEREKTASR